MSDPVHRPAGTPSQIATIAAVMLKNWSRSSPIAGRAPAKGGWEQASGPLLRALFLLVLMPALHQMARGVVEAGSGRLAATRLLLHGALFYGVGVSLATEAPELPGARNLLRSPLLSSLPLSATARISFGLLQSSFVAVGMVAMVLGVSPERTGLRGLAEALALGVGLYVASSVGGLALASVLRLVVRPSAWTRISWLAGALSVIGLLLVVSAPILGPLWLTKGSMDPALVLARTLASKAGMTPALLALGCVSTLSLLVVGFVEWRGYDRLDAVPHEPPKTSAVTTTDADGLERLLSTRELGGRFHVAVLVGISAALSVFLAWHSRSLKSKTFDGVAMSLAVILAQIGSSAALGRAGRSVLRDARARPLLSSLPLEPSATLQGKAKATLWLLWPLPLAFLPWVVIAPAATQLQLVWRMAALTVGLFLFTEASVSIAFLTNGLGAPGAKTVGAPVNLGSLLLFLPLLGAVAASHPAGAVISLASLWALSFEARRAAERCVRWMDDASEELERQTPIWRALIVFAAFQAIQGLTGQVLALGAAGMSAALRLSLSYVISALSLVLMAHANDIRLGRRSLLPDSPWALGLGLLGGALSGALALGYLHAARALGLSAPSVSGAGGAAEVIGLLLAVVVLAPIAEETFFRGWLQLAIGRELPDRLRRYALPITALVFAAAHPPASFLPVFALGLVTGALARRGSGLLACMLAHAVHNAVSMLGANL